MQWLRIDTPVGPFDAATRGGAVVAAGFGLLPDPAAGSWASRRGSDPVRDALEAYFAGAVDAVDALAVGATGTEFQLRVWRALRAVPAGTTTTYGELARAVGVPGASRAVGRANAANPVAVVVPCHRVVRADGRIGGYAAGPERKRWLLGLESRSKTSAVTIP
ncbi:MAG: hypothetical protein KatS3mg009_0560 [Acidimicrobiia bacterium]|nr:MAG: hypothetical protein KatS3mg009_0560 [Acidimicrobiia bacterium]